jgi:RNA polymerase sigma-70 factor (ECF subfamily)
MDRTRFLESATGEWRSVYRFALRLTRDAHGAEDLVQDVYTQALRPERIQAFEPQRGGMRAWLLRITYRAFLAVANRGRNDGLLFRPLEEAQDSLAREALPASRTNNFDWEGVDERIKDAVAHLDEGSREVLLLWAIDELQYQEIADVLEIPIGTVMSRLHRARTNVSGFLLADPSAREDLGLPTSETRPRAQRKKGGIP